MTANVNLRTLAAELDEARQDVALLERLKAAPDRLKRLTADYGKAVAAHEKIKAAAEKAASEARFKGLSDIKVTDTTPRDNVLRTGFTITYIRMAYDIDAGQSISQPTTVTGFASLPDNVFAFLVERHPAQIPAKIMALAPDDPKEAFARYFRGLSRGYISG